MPAYSKGLLQIPQGTEGIYLEEAFKHRRIVRSIEELFTSWGYLPAQVPIFDFFDTYRRLVGNVDAVYRLIDREGDLLMLRPDITLFLAKQVGMSLSEEDLPLRLCYADGILRHQDSEDISRNEFFQVGAELIGRQGVRGDLEIICLLSDVLALLELPHVHIHLGSRRLLSLVAEKIPNYGVMDLADMIESRDGESLSAAASSSGLDGGRLSALFLFLDSPDSLAPLISEYKGDDPLYSNVKTELQRLEMIAKTVMSVYPETSLRIDLSEIGSQAYYTGVVFQAYAEGADRAVASGGRYDELLGHFGSSSPSVGFSMLLRKIESLVGAAERFEVPEARVIEEKDVAKALSEAKAARLDGGIVVL